MKNILKMVLFVGVLTGPWLGGLRAQAPERSMTGQPQTYVIQGEPYVVAGFGKARFGMSMDEVRQVVAREYPTAGGVVREEQKPAERTRSLTIVVPDLAPGPGPATVSYIFSANPPMLTAIHVFWLLEGDPVPAARQTLIQAGSLLTAGVLGYQWKPLRSVRGHVLSPGTLVLFLGQDLAGGGLEIRLDGVAMDIERRQDPAGIKTAPEHRPAPKGPARLRVSFVSTTSN